MGAAQEARYPAGTPLKLSLRRTPPVTLAIIMMMIPPWAVTVTVAATVRLGTVGPGPALQAWSQ